MKKAKYIIVTEERFIDFTRLVNEQIEQGYEPLGNPVRERYCWHQSMIYKGTENPKFADAIFYMISGAIIIMVLWVFFKTLYGA